MAVLFNPSNAPEGYGESILSTADLPILIAKFLPLLIGIGLVTGIFFFLVNKTPSTSQNSGTTILWAAVLFILVMSYLCIFVLLPQYLS
jgi:hypothetical protein